MAPSIPIPPLREKPSLLHLLGPTGASLRHGRILRIAFLIGQVIEQARVAAGAGPSSSADVGGVGVRISSGGVCAGTGAGCGGGVGFLGLIVSLVGLVGC